MNSYSVVIPVYKSTKSLEILTNQIKELEKDQGYKFEIIFVNDSPNFYDTEKVLKQIQQEHTNVRVLTLRKNQGQHVALLIGIKYATGQYIITMDDDLQHPVSEIPKLIKAITENNQVEAIFAVPAYKNKKHSLWRNIGSYIINRIDSLFLKKPNKLVKSAFRIMTTDLAKVIVSNYNAMPAVSSLIINSTNSIINIEVEHGKRVYGEGNYSFHKLINLTLNTILHYSSLPLKIVGFIGIIGFLFSLIFISIVIVRKLYMGIAFPGYASTVSLICFFGGLNLLALGLIGEYLIRILKEQQKVPLNDYIKKSE
jgi:dolichol-phosphate mannosyltransferase/undecaprenyl-phosphate 4-deoxy-4-formamido-L-arabinose transferase